MLFICHALASAHCCLGVTCWADLLALVCDDCVLSLFHVVSSVKCGT